MKKTIPAFKTDKEAQEFVDTADLTEYDLSGGTRSSSNSSRSRRASTCEFRNRFSMP